MKHYIQSTIFRKVLSAITGLFLVSFLLGHLAGNLQLFIPGVDGQTQFNKYALFMTTNPVVNMLSIITYLSIILHIIVTLYLTVLSRKARPIGYAVNNNSASSKWSSRNMSVLGVVILLFLIVHLRSFWYEMHFGNIPYQYLEDGTKLKDLHKITVSAFQNPLYTAFYILCMVALSYHLMHGVESAIQTIGLKLPSYERAIKYAGKFLALTIPTIFASIPIYLYFTRS